MRVRPHDGRDSPIQVPAKQLFVAGGLGVKIDKAKAHLGVNLRQHPIGRLKRTINRPHEHPAQQTHHRDPHAVAGSDDGKIAARSRGRIIGRFDDVGARTQDRLDFGSAIDVITTRGDDIDTGGQQLMINRSGVMPEPPAAFSPLATTRSSPSRWINPGIARTTICLPGLPTISPMRRIRTKRSRNEVQKVRSFASGKSI